MGRVAVPFWDRVNKESGFWHDGNQCWDYTGTGGSNQFGHRRHWIPGVGMVSAHGYAYRELVGPIEEGKVLDHLCERPCCVNPAHLHQTTQRGNLTRTTRTVAGANAAKTHCKRGHEFTEANTYWTKGRSGRLERQCRTCHAAKARRQRAARRVG